MAKEQAAEMERIAGLSETDFQKEFSDKTKAVEDARLAHEDAVDELNSYKSEWLTRTRKVAESMGISLGGSGRGKGSSGGSGNGKFRMSKNNSWIIENVGSGISMDDLKAEAKKKKLNEMSVYQAALKLIKSGVLNKDGERLTKGAAFPKP